MCDLWSRSPRAAPSRRSYGRIVPREELLKAAGDADLVWTSISFETPWLERHCVRCIRGRSPHWLHVAHVHCGSHRDGLWARVHHPYQYSYKALTRPSHRRKRIHVAINRLCRHVSPGARLRVRSGVLEIGNLPASAWPTYGSTKKSATRDTWCFRTSIPFRSRAVKKIGAELFELQE